MTALPLVTVCILFTRPQNLERAAGNFERQRYPHKRLIVVEGKAGIGQFPSHRCEAVLDTGSDPNGVWSGRNASFRWLRERGGGLVTWMDDDDYYGPGYLDELVRLKLESGGDVVGKRLGFVLFPSGLWQIPVAQDITIGGATLVDANVAMDYLHMASGEDTRWCQLMKRRGKTFAFASPWHFCYRRDEGTNSWKCEEERMRGFTRGAPSLFYGDMPETAVDDVTIQPVASVPCPAAA